MRFGFHVSISGGFGNVRERALEVGCETLQLFTRSPQMWQGTKLDPEDVAKFRSDMKEAGIAPLFCHVPYLPNLAAPKGPYLKRSITVTAEELQRCAELGIPYFITHVGKALGAGEQEALEQVAESVNRAFERAPNRTVLLLENTAGMGTEVGYRFEQIAAIVERVEDKDRVGVMLDTAHSFEAGYDWRTRETADAALREFDRTIGLGRLIGLHLNDSKTEFGSRVDRHWHIGKGRIGKQGMAVIVNHPLLRHLPAVMETPRETAKEDRMNLRAVRGLVE